MIYAPFATDQELQQVVREFEDQTLPPLRWTHREHLAVAAVYAKRHGDGALDCMRSGIKALNAAHGVVDTPTGGYHETLTRAWMQLLRQLSDREPGLHELDLANKALALLADKRLLLNYYSRESIMSAEARAGWVDPDLNVLRLEQLEIRNEA